MSAIAVPNEVSPVRQKQAPVTPCMAGQRGPRKRRRAFQLLPAPTFSNFGRVNRFGFVGRHTTGQQADRPEFESASAYVSLQGLSFKSTVL